MLVARCVVESNLGEQFALSNYRAIEFFQYATASGCRLSVASEGCGRGLIMGTGEAMVFEGPKEARLSVMFSGKLSKIRWREVLIEFDRVAQRHHSSLQIRETRQFTSLLLLGTLLLTAW